MKRFTQKFFLLAIGMILSVGASAQDAIQHRFPAVPYSTGGRNYILPAWDAQITDVNAIRMQLLEPLPENKEDTVRAKIVARRAFSIETNNYGSPMFASLGEDNDVTIGETTKARSQWTYGNVAEALPELASQISSDIATWKVFDLTSGSKFVGDDFEIPTSYTIGGSSYLKGYIFKIVEIGVGAFRNYDTAETNSAQNIIWIKKTLTIPNTIEVIEHDAFRHNRFTEVVFAEGSKIKTIEKATFEGCILLENINIPSTVETIEGTAFGGCQALNKMVFEGNLPTLTTKDEEPEYTGHGAYKGPYDIFTAAQRFSYYNKNVTPSKCIIQVPLDNAKTYAANAVINQFPMSSKFPIETSSGIMSYCSDLDFTFKKYNTDNPQQWGAAPVKVYYVEDTGVDVDNGKVDLTEVPEGKLVPGYGPSNDFGVVIKGTSGETYDIYYPNGHGNMTEKLTMEETSNVLHGCVQRTLVEVTKHPEWSYFILTGGKFKRILSDGHCNAYRAYILDELAGYGGTIGADPTDPDGDGGARELVISFPEDTGIANHEAKSLQNDAWYTLQGVQVNQPQKGIFIKNGKKFVIK